MICTPTFVVYTTQSSAIGLIAIVLSVAVLTLAVIWVRL